MHYRVTDSTNARARELALRGAPAGTVVTARSQTAGRGRQGRTWAGTPGGSLLCSVLVRGSGPLLPLRAGVAVAEVCGPQAQIKWPNDVLLDGGKVAGVLVEGRPQAGWAVVGIGLNVAVERDELPPEVRERAASLGRDPAALESTLAELLAALDHWLAVPDAAVRDAVAARDALLGQPVRWADGSGTGAGIDALGRLLVARDGGEVAALDAGEVHLGRAFG